MPSIYVRNFSDDLYEKIKQRAKEHGRSIRVEVIAMLEEGIRMRKLQREQEARREATRKRIEKLMAQERQARVSKKHSL